ncbi:neutral amino acid permease [Fusarium albosuccineum]|uniref:Neutral amino acid permease n=1 Tax=Fusarium albosuccineum TaxID=1237068 RepID=A0A8H4LAT3_9HYPO|nr:neutral amino acid permease [Fusarium albosuccineum]
MHASSDVSSLPPVADRNKKSQDDGRLSPTDEEPGNKTDTSGTGDFEAAHHEELSDGIFDGENGKSFRNMSRWDALFALLCNQFGLGVLGLPGAMRDLGIVPGIIALIGIGCLSGYAGLELLQFFERYPHVVNVIDMVRIIGGRPWEIVAAIGLIIQLLMTCASTAVTLSVALNTLSDHGMCTVGFIGIACIACFLLCVPRTAKFIAHSGVPTVISIVIAALIVMISLGASSPPKAPPGWDVSIEVVATPSFRKIFNACLRIVFAFAGNITFVSFMAEMRNPVRDFPYALSGLIGISIGFYVILAVTIYCLAGEYTTSPALGSAPIIPAKVAYGIVIPAVMTAGLANGHVGIKYVYVQVLRWMKRTHEATSNSAFSWGVWLGSVTVFWIASFLVSNVIPIFDSILSISSATTYAWFTYGISACLWFHLNKGRYFDGPKQIAYLCLNVFLIGFSFLLNGAGLWASMTELLDLFKAGGVRGVFDCGNNAIF